MVRVSRFGWHENGPVGREFDKDDWLGGPEDEVDTEPQARPGRTRRNVRKTSPVDRGQSANRPESDVRQRPD